MFFLILNWISEIYNLKIFFFKHLTVLWKYSVQFSSVAQSCPTLCDPVKCHTPGFPVHQQLLACSNPCPLSWWCPLIISSSVIPSPPALRIRVFPSESVLHIRWPVYWSFNFSLSHPKDIQDWFHLGLTGLIFLQSKGLSRVFSTTTIQKHQLFNTKLSLWSKSHIHT